MTLRTLISPLVIAVLVAAPAAGKESPGPIGAVAATDDAVFASVASLKLARIDTETLVVTHRLSTRPAYVRDLAVGAGGIWGIGPCVRPRCRYGVLMQFHPATGRRTRGLTRLGINPRAIAVGAGAVWVLGARQLLRIDPTTARLAVRGPRVFRVGRNAQDVAVGRGVVWVTTARRRGQAGPIVGPCRLVSVTPSGRVTQWGRIPCVPRTAAFGLGRVWTNRTAGVPRTTSDLAVGIGRVWSIGVRNPHPGEFGALSGTVRLTGINPDNETHLETDIATAQVGVPRIAVGAGAVWVANAPSGTITRLDPATGAITGSVDADRR